MGRAERMRPDLRMVPLAISAWGATWLVTGELPSWLTWSIGGLATGAALLAWGRRRWWVLAVALVAITGLGAGGARVHQVRTGPLADWARQGAAVSCRVQVTSDPRLIDARGPRPALGFTPARTELCRARGIEVRQRGAILLRATGDRIGWVVGMVPGSTVEVSGLMREPDPGQPIVAILVVRAPPDTVGGPGPGARAVNRFRDTLRQVGAASTPEQRALLPSLVVGDTSQVSDALAAQFRATALTHLMAVSGANLALTLVVMVNAARWVGLKGWSLRVLAVLAVAAFVAVCRAEPSVVRAAGMGLVALAALGRGGPHGRGIRHLAAAVLALVLIDPWLSRSVGFALSVAACAGILWWSRSWADAMSRWAPRWLAEAISVPMAAQLATQPLVTWLSGGISVVGLAANAAAAPFVGPATVVGLVAGAVGLIWLPAGVAVGWLAGWLLAPILAIARAGAALPTATWSWPQSAGAIAVLAALCAVMAVSLSTVLSRRWLSAAMAVVLVVGALRPQPSPGWPGPWAVVACSVGQGDAWVLRAGPHSAVLVDVGPEPDPVRQCLRALGVRQIAMVVLTHYHADHVTGLAMVLDEFPVGQLLVSPLTSPAAQAAQVGRLAAVAGVPVRQASAGEQWLIGGVTWRTIRAGPIAGAVMSADEGESSAENDSSVMGVATLGELSVLFAGDSEPAAQSAALATGESLHALVLAMPHHGSGRQTPAFWKATGATLAVASAGVDNDYGHPAGASLALAASCGMRVARTDTQGSVAIWLRDGHLHVRTRR